MQKQLAPIKLFQNVKSMARFEDVARRLSCMDIESRKRVILLCRAQCVPDPHCDSLLRRQAFPHSTKYRSSYRAEDDVQSFARQYEEDISHPLFSSLVIDIAKSLPLAAPEIQKAKLDSWGKEISLCEGVRRPYHFDFRCWFDAKCRDIPLLPTMPANPDMADEIRTTLQMWKLSMRGRTFYPSMSTKLVSRSTIREHNYFAEHQVEVEESGSEFSQVELERFYHEHGFELGGVCEIRQKWYRHGLKPRTYFAQGGESYQSSKYLQDVFNALVDFFISSNHTARLNPSRLRPADDEYCRIYDLSGFTSNEHEQLPFLKGLAKFCEGTMVKIVDSREGLVAADLGDLISEYALYNDEPKYSREKLLDQDVAECRHTIASFLGVYGNLMTCTFPHAASLAYGVGSSSKVNVAGDDAHFLQRRGEEKKITPFIRANGVVERSKEFSTDEEGAVCLKRGLVQEDNRLYQKMMIIWPSLAVTSFVLKGVHLPSQFGRMFKSRGEARLALGTELLRFLQSLHWERADFDLDQVLDYLRALYTQTGFPPSGQLPQLGAPYLVPALPEHPIDLLECPIRRLASLHYSGGVVLSERLPRNEVEEIQFENAGTGYEWFGHMSRKIVYFEKMGWVSSSPRKKLYTGLEGFDRLIKEFYDPDPVVYEFVVICPIPEEFHF
jgi:hypothetical protein